MIPETTIKICGKEVKMIYCAATENGYEDLSNKSISVFVPEFGKDDEGNDIIVKPAQAHIGDFVTLAVAGIVAYYAKNKQEVPITAEEILYDAKPVERNELIAEIVRLRTEWYNVPDVVKPDIKPDEKGEKPKNAQPPTTDTKS